MADPYLKNENLRELLNELVRLWNRWNGKNPDDSLRPLVKGKKFITVADLHLEPINSGLIQRMYKLIGTVPNNRGGVYVHTRDNVLGELEMAESFTVGDKRGHFSDLMWVESILGERPTIRYRYEDEDIDGDGTIEPVEEDVFQDRADGSPWYVIAEYMQWVDDMLDLMQYFVVGEIDERNYRGAELNIFIEPGDTMDVPYAAAERELGTWAGVISPFGVPTVDNFNGNNHSCLRYKDVYDLNRPPINGDIEEFWDALQGQAFGCSTTSGANFTGLFVEDAAVDSNTSFKEIVWDGLRMNYDLSEYKKPDSTAVSLYKTFIPCGMHANNLKYNALWSYTYDNFDPLVVPADLVGVGERGERGLEVTSNIWPVIGTDYETVEERLTAVMNRPYNYPFYPHRQSNIYGILNAWIGVDRWHGQPYVVCHAPVT